MFPNLFQATKEYWHKLDELEIAYQQGKIPLEEVDAKVADLMAQLAQERRAALAFFWHSWYHWLTKNKENLIALAIVALATYAWVLVKYNHLG